MQGINKWFALCIVVFSLRSHAANWGAFKADQCTGIGVRQYSAVLWNISGSWEEACKRQPATILNQTFSSPARCKNTGQMWGEFDVSDPTCTPNWGEFKANQCVNTTTRMFSAVLWNIPPGFSWESACRATGASINGQSFASPTRCINTGTNIWGEFDAIDATCSPTWGEFKADHCISNTTRQYSAVLWNIPINANWEATCASTGGSVNGLPFSKPNRCINTGNAIWGEVQLPDSSCQPHWGEIKNDGCVALGARKYSAVLWNIPPGQPWLPTCRAAANTIRGVVFTSPTRCVESGLNIWGEWEVSDSECLPKWGEFKKEECSDSGKRIYSAVLWNIPGGISWEDTCRSTPAVVGGRWFRNPVLCEVQQPGINVWGRFELEDSECAGRSECSDSAVPEGAFAKNGNTGAVSCDAYCANRDAPWGKKGACVKGIIDKGPNAGLCIRCNEVPAQTGNNSTTCFCRSPLKGFADLHGHQFANEGFGGIAFHGKSFGRPEDALRWCTEAHQPGGAGDVISKGLGHGVFGHRVGGWPELDGWPRWNSYSHQSMYIDWLERAWKGGLRLLVNHAVNNKDIFTMFPVYATKKPGRSGEDMEAVDFQIAEALLVQSAVDDKNGGPGRGWYRIVRTPSEARQVISQGKLAVVLGIEVDNLFDCRTEADCSEAKIVSELDRYYAKGIRHLFPIHFKENAFGGAALSNPLTVGRSRFCSDEGYEYQRDILKPAICASQGLTHRGKFLIREMMKRGMIIDIDHMSVLAFNDTLDITEPIGYPVVSGHTGFFDIARAGKRHEGNLKASQVERIRKSGGMVAIIPHQGDEGEITQWTSGSSRIQNACANSSATLAQAYLYAVGAMKGGAVAFGSDFNGFAGMPGPRFGEDACPGALPFSRGAQAHAQTNRVKYPISISVEGSVNSLPAYVASPKRTFDFNTDGLAHVGLLPDLIEDWRVQGMQPRDLEPLYESAEAYVALWERALAKAKK